MARHSRNLFLGALIVHATVVIARHREGEAPPAARAMKSQSFDRDSGWDAHNNRIVPKEYPTVTQDFGYSQTNVAGKAAGEMGGQVHRAAEPAFYADKIGA